MDEAKNAGTPPSIEAVLAEVLTPTLFRAWLERQRQPLLIWDYYRTYLGLFLPTVAANEGRLLIDQEADPFHTVLQVDIDGAYVPFPDWVLDHFLSMCAREPEAELDPAVALALLDRSLEREAKRGDR